LVVFDKAEADPMRQTPSPKLTKTLARQSSLKIIYTYASNVRIIPLIALLIFPSWGLTLTLPVPEAERNGRKTLTTVQGLPKKFDQKKILKVIKKKFGKSPQQDGPGAHQSRPS
jgi:hypothetical protein